MYLLYIDESGTPTGRQENHFVLAGIAAYERRTFYLQRDVNALQEKYFAGSVAPIEFHANAIRQHRIDPWKSLAPRKRTELFQDLCNVINKSRCILFGVIVDMDQDGNALIRAFEEICNRFDLFLKRLHNQDNSQRGLLIFDETHYESRLQTLLQVYQDAGTRFGSVNNFSDIPFFADSKSTRMLQLADLVSHAVFRNYESNDPWLFNQILNKFDSEYGHMHGLVHLTNDNNCRCQACDSRRWRT